MYRCGFRFASSTPPAVVISATNTTTKLATTQNSSLATHLWRHCRDDEKSSMGFISISGIRSPLTQQSIYLIFLWSTRNSCSVLRQQQRISSRPELWLWIMALFLVNSRDGKCCSNSSTSSISNLVAAWDCEDTIQRLVWRLRPLLHIELNYTATTSNLSRHTMRLSAR